MLSVSCIIGVLDAPLQSLYTSSYSNISNYSPRMFSLDRLIDLAQKTGDRLIIHDPVSGNDTVLLDIDTYEHLVLGRKNIHKLSEGQLLEQINRDIAVWRSNKEMDEFGERGHALEEELIDHPLSDPFEEDFVHSYDWHSAGSVIDRMPRELFSDEDEDEDLEEIERLSAMKRNWGIPSLNAEDDEDDWEIITAKAGSRPYGGTKLRNYNIVDTMEESGKKLDRSPWDASPVPMQEDEEEISFGKNEPLLSEDPVFYEEPV